MNLKTVSIVIIIFILRVIISSFLKLIYKLGKYKCVNKFYKKIADGLYFSSVIGLTLESYLEFLISTWFTLTQPINGQNGDIISLSISCVIAFLALIFLPVSSIWMIFQDTKTLLKKRIEKTWGELYYDVKIKTAPQRAFRISHGIKALVFVLASFLLRENNCLQIEVILILNLCFIIYIGSIRPLIWVFDNKLELFNTTYISMIFIFSIVYSDFYDIKVGEDTLGMISIALIAFFILINILIVFY